MNYEKIHNQIIERAKNRILSGYGEVHHIIPKCMGGGNSKDNLVKLTAKEHFIIHKLLVEIYPNNNKLHYAAWLMCKLKKGYRVGAREYRRFKENVKLSDEHKERIKSGMKTAPNLDYWRGKNLSDTHRINISLGMSGKVRSKQHQLNQNKSIVQYDLNNNIVAEYNSIKEAGVLNGIFPSNISAVLRGKSSKSGGFFWKYKKN